MSARPVVGALVTASLAAGQLVPAPALLAPLGATAAHAQSSRTISCASRGMSRTSCRIPAGASSVTLVRQDSRAVCAEGQSWGWGGTTLWVDAGCAGLFRVSYGGFGGSGGSWGGGWGGSGGGWSGSGGSWQNQGFAGELRCTSDNFRERFCRARTQGRATLVRQLSSSGCVEGQTWRVERGGIRVREGCDGVFAYGFGSYDPQGFGGSGGSWEQSSQQHGHGGSGAAVAGGLLAAGLIAALVAAGKSANHGSGPPAQLQASLTQFPSASRTEARACLNEAARQVGATGGTSVRLDRVISSRRQPDGAWRHQALLTKVWPDHRQQMRMDCVASGSRVRAFDVS